MDGGKGGGGVGSSGPGLGGGAGGRWQATHTRAWLQSCSLPGLSCPKEKKAREKRNVNFQKAINEKCELWALTKLCT